jgi:hypothetical protein
MGGKTFQTCLTKKKIKSMTIPSGKVRISDLSQRILSWVVKKTPGVEILHLFIFEALFSIH